MNAIIDSEGKFVAMLTGEHDLAPGYSLVEIDEQIAAHLNDACRYDGAQWIFPTIEMPVAKPGETIITI